MKKIMIIGLFLSCTANAADTGLTKIKEILVGSNFGTKVLLELTNKPQPAAGCNNNPRYSYVFDGGTNAGKILLSVALAAHAAQKDVYISGADLCNLFGGVEDMNSIRSIQ